MIPLLEANPMLVDLLPHWPVCQLPTPIGSLSGFGRTVGLADLSVKRDDLTGVLFGGNKIRSLEFLLPAAHRDGGNLVIGLAGTSMALAANIYARYFELPLKTYLVWQRPSVESRANLRYFGYLEADLEEIESPDEIDNVMGRYNGESLTWYGHPSHWLNPISPLGMCGYVNAGYELAVQVAAGEIEEPDLIFIAAGLLGTAAGLLVGLRAAGLSTSIVAVSHDWIDAEASAAGEMAIVSLAGSAADFLRVLSPDFPAVSIDNDDVSLAGPPPDDPRALVDAGLAFRRVLNDKDGIRIEPTWTAQVIGEIHRRAAAGELAGRKVLFWHTSNSRPHPAEAEEVDYHLLPQPFWVHFETEELVTINRPVRKG
jgi:D-cysteine desulfhydrase